jgi:hypothetical protein
VTGSNDETVRRAPELNALRESDVSLAGQLAEFSAAHETLLRSTNWRLTAPLRNFAAAAPWLRAPLRRATRPAVGADDHSPGAQRPDRAPGRKQRFQFKRTEARR